MGIRVVDSYSNGISLCHRLIIHQSELWRKIMLFITLLINLVILFTWDAPIALDDSVPEYVHV